MKQLTADYIWRIKALETNIVLALVALLAGVLADFRLLIWLGIILLVLSIAIKPVAAVLAKSWLWVSTKIAFVNSTIILTVIFYLFLTPIALIYRMFNKDPLALDMNYTGSFYAERKHTYVKADLEKMW